MFRQSLVALTALVAFSAVGAAPAAAQDISTMAGRVMDPNPEAAPSIRRANGQVVPARYPTPLFAGDVIQLEPSQELSIRVQGRRQKLRGKDWPNGYRVPNADRGAIPCCISAAVRAYLERGTVVGLGSTYARSPDGAKAIAAAASALAPAGRQWLPPQTKSVALIWQGPISDLAIKAGKGSETVVSTYQNSWAQLALPAGQGEVQITGLESPLVWKIGYRAAPPAPPGMPSSSPDMAAGQRLARAVWLLTDGPAEWRLFALSELASLAEAGDFVAGELWTAAKYGELPVALGKAP